MVLWIKISSKLFDIDEDVLIGNIYVLPENSRYKVPDSLKELEQNFLNFANSFK